ncbi:MAG TPA: hypothetical protein DCP69_07920 [Candidatus Omnitrophica bacterium]|nr:hypothetical protein [Candidatus Omnitrophota bacterium]
MPVLCGLFSDPAALYVLYVPYVSLTSGFPVILLLCSTPVPIKLSAMVTALVPDLWRAKL